MSSTAPSIAPFNEKTEDPTVQGYIHSIETAGTVDGPGLRFVVFLSGCPLRCLYCHNPDTRAPHAGRQMAARDLAREIATYKDFLLLTGGGVTATGGEPLLQQAFVTELFKECHKLGLPTALDTSGYLGKKVDPALLEATDLVLLDIKSFDPVRYQKITGMHLQPTLDFAAACAARQIPLWIRCVVVPGLTDDLDMFKKLAVYLKTLGTVEKIEVLPFHKMGEPKWAAMGLTYELKDTPPPAKDLIEAVQKIFSDNGFTVQ